MNARKLPSASEKERLALLTEEIGEVLQVIGKIERHGYENFHPDKPSVTNRNLLEKELGHLQHSVLLMLTKKDICLDRLNASADSKRVSIKRWLRYPSNRI